MNHKVLVILAPGFEEVEAITVIDILRRAQIETVTASLENDRQVPGSHGIAVMADTTLSSVSSNDFTCLALPGGLRGVENMLKSESVTAVVKEMASRETILAAVCAAPLILDAQGLLDGLRFTCHPCVYDRLAANGVQNIPACVDGRIVTGRSAGCAMPWSIELVRVLLGAVPEGLTAGLRLP